MGIRTDIKSFKKKIVNKLYLDEMTCVIYLKSSDTKDEIKVQSKRTD